MGAQAQRFTAFRGQSAGPLCLPGDWAAVSVQYSKPLPIQEIKAAGDGSWECAGYVSTFNNRDLGGDIVLPGAFDKSLSDGRKVKFLYAHDQSQVLGTAISLKADQHGLFGRFKISRTRLGEDVHTLLKDGALDSFSIGFFIDDLDWDAESDSRLLKDINLLESSVVAIPMNPDALVTHVKNRQTMDEEASSIVVSIKSFIERCSDLADLRMGQGRPPLSSPVIERLQTVRTAADELLALQAVKAVDATAPPTEPAPTPDDAPPPPGDPQPRASYSSTLEIRRRRLRSLGILEPMHREHDRR